MILLLKTHYDKLLLALTMALVTLSISWVWRQQPPRHALRALPVTGQPMGSRYEPVSVRRPEMSPAVWAKPATQSDGNGWLYEIFTPPVIYYNPQDASFTVTPPQDRVDSGTPFGLELVEVRREPYRLQLVGYFGGPGDFQAVFVIPNSSGIILAREGHRFESLELTLRSLTVEKVAVDHNDAWPVYDVAALAVLEDEKTGAEVVLDSRARKLTDTRLAVFQLAIKNVLTSELHEGDTLSAEDFTYRIEHIQFDPPEVRVARQTAGLSQSEIRILHPVARNAGRAVGQPATAEPISARPAAGLTTNKK